MDPALAAMAASGAQAIMTLMATDVWEKGKGLVTRAFKTSSENDEKIEDELEKSRALVLGKQNADIVQNEESRWDAKLRLRLIEDPSVRETLEKLVETASGATALLASQSGNISMDSHSSGESRVYQQGHGIQHNG